MSDVATPPEAEKRALDSDGGDTKRVKFDDDADTAMPDALSSPGPENEDTNGTAEPASDSGEPVDTPDVDGEANGTVDTPDASAEAADEAAGEAAGEAAPETNGSSNGEAVKQEEGATASASKDAGESTPLERARRAAEAAKVTVPEGMDPAEPSPEGLPKHQQRYATSAIKAIKRLKDAAPFLVPVDPEKLGIPQYFEYIKSPMDLGSLENKLTNGEYQTVRQVADDYDLIVSNCIIFNGEDAFISKMAMSIAQSFNKHLSNMPFYNETDPKHKRRSSAAPGRTSTTPIETAVSPTPAAAVDANSAHRKQLLAPGVPVIRRESNVSDGRPKREIHPPKPRDLPYAEPKPRNKKFAGELRFASQIVREFLGRKHEAIAWPFLEPVDPVAQGVPDYFDIVKEPMDLKTIQRKLQEYLYYNGEEFEADIRLMFRNCYTYNPEGTPVNDLGHKLEAVFDRRWVEKPQPVSTPPPMQSSDESDIDDEYESLGLANPAIDILEEQLAMIQQQLRRLKKDAVREWREKRSKKKGSRASTVGGGTHVRRQSQAIGSAVGGHSRKQSVKEDGPITYEMKKELSEKISTLPEQKLRRVVAIIQESMPQLKNSGQDEIELEMDQLEPATLRQLYNYAVRNKSEEEPQKVSTPAPQPTSMPQKKKKSKPLTEDEQNRQIEEIQNKLRQFEQLQGGGASIETSLSAPAPLSDDSSSSSDDNADSEDSSSEEE